MLIKDIISPRLEISLLTCLLNRDFILINQISRVAVAWHYLGWYCILVILAKIFIIGKDIISVK